MWALPYKDAEGDQQMLDIFAFLLLGAATFAAFNLVSRTVEAQRREIGIGMALGVPPRALARRPLLLGTQIALAGVVLGIPVGLAADAWLASVMQQFFPLPVARASFQSDLYVRGAVLGLALPLLATALPCGVRCGWRRSTRFASVRAPRAAAAWHGCSRACTSPGGSLANLPLRNVLRTPRRTLMTLLGIGAVVTIVIALAGVMDSFDKTLTTSRQRGARGRPEPPDRRPHLAGAAPTARTSQRVAAAHRRSAQTRRRCGFASTLVAGTAASTSHSRQSARDRPLWHPTFAGRHAPVARPGPADRPARRGRSCTSPIGDRLTVSHPSRRGAAHVPARPHDASRHRHPHQPAALRRLRQHAGASAAAPQRPRQPRLGRARPRHTTQTTSRPSSCACPRSPRSRAPQRPPTPSTLAWSSSTRSC